MAHGYDHFNITGHRTGGHYDIRLGAGRGEGIPDFIHVISGLTTNRIDPVVIATYGCSVQAAAIVLRTISRCNTQKIHQTHGE